MVCWGLSSGHDPLLINVRAFERVHVGGLLQPVCYVCLPGFVSVLCRIRCLSIGGKSTSGGRILRRGCSHSSPMLRRWRPPLPPAMSSAIPPANVSFHSADIFTQHNATYILQLHFKSHLDPFRVFQLSHWGNLKRFSKESYRRVFAYQIFL